MEQLLLKNQLCFRLYSVNKAMTRLYTPILKELSLTYPQYLVMLVLWEHEKGLTVNEIGHLLDLDSGTLSPLLKRMSQQDLITKQRATDDERKVHIVTTAHGKQIKQKAKLIPAKLLSKANLCQQQYQTLAKELDKLLTQLTSQDTLTAQNKR